MISLIRTLAGRWGAAGTAVGSAAAAAVLTACSAIPDNMPGLERSSAAQAFTPNDFDGASMYMRRIRASQERTCEAARRALLSQGYVVQSATAELVSARKYYQPHADTHYSVEMRVVCAPEGDDLAAAFASAVQDRYVIKKVNNSASLGVGGIGTVSLPFSASDDTLVKVGSETISDPRFYASFFELFRRYVPVLREGTGGGSATTGRTAALPPLQEREAVLPE